MYSMSSVEVGCKCKFFKYCSSSFLLFDSKMERSMYRKYLQEHKCTYCVLHMNVPWWHNNTRIQARHYVKVRSSFVLSNCNCGASTNFLCLFRSLTSTAMLIISTTRLIFHIIYLAKKAWVTHQWLGTVYLIIYNNEDDILLDTLSSRCNTRVKSIIFCDRFPDTTLIFPLAANARQLISCIMSLN